MDESKWKYLLSASRGPHLESHTKEDLILSVLEVCGSRYTKTELRKMPKADVIVILRAFIDEKRQEIRSKAFQEVIADSCPADTLYLKWDHDAEGRIPVESPFIKLREVEHTLQDIKYRVRELQARIDRDRRHAAAILSAMEHIDSGLEVGFGERLDKEAIRDFICRLLERIGEDIYVG